VSENPTCPKCGATIELDGYSDGKWRYVCPKCLTAKEWGSMFVREASNAVEVTIQERLSAYLRLFAVGRDRAIHQAELRQELACDEAVLSKAITDSRLAGEPICTGDPGVWYATEREDLDGCIAWLTSSIATRAAVIRSLTATREKMFPATEGMLFRL
jgi:ribosomal protein S27AE